MTLFSKKASHEIENIHNSAKTYILLKSKGQRFFSYFTWRIHFKASGTPEWKSMADLGQKWQKNLLFSIILL